ncbi:uncharacterized protein LOC111270692 isoform X2 [Varroa jacobsoni]|uniref:uncharacterized protein LOC111270692 isoform X2 n=1 Tax=Varroa jacobsoni TaxID=62625 RepID=UPI000BF41D2C|nr:uncharacterized protein LOC111270692 isoform X2 [Varroa jacobsoni]
MSVLQQEGFNLWPTCSTLAAAIATAVLLLPQIGASNRTVRVGSERWDTAALFTGNATFVLGFACRIGLPPKLDFPVPKDYCHGINGTCVRGVCVCRRGYYRYSDNSCQPAKSGLLHIVLSVLSWLPITYLLLVLTAAMYNAFVQGVAMIIEREVGNAVLEAGSSSITSTVLNDAWHPDTGGARSTSCTSGANSRRCGV